MCKQGIKFILVAPIIVFAMLCAPQLAQANAVSDTFHDIAGQADFLGENRNPGDITLSDEHGLTFANDDSVALSVIWSWGGSGVVGRLSVTNTSSQTMFDTIVAFEDTGVINWQTQTLASWDGTDDSGSAAYWFGDIDPGLTSNRFLDLKSGHINWAPAYDSLGLDSEDDINGVVSNMSVSHAAVVPEPISSTLFIVGGATLGFRRFRKKRKIL